VPEGRSDRVTELRSDRVTECRSTGVTGCRAWGPAPWFGVPVGNGRPFRDSEVLVPWRSAGPVAPEPRGPASAPSGVREGGPATLDAVGCHQRCQERVPPVGNGIDLERDSESSCSRRRDRAAMLLSSDRGECPADRPGRRLRTWTSGSGGVSDCLCRRAVAGRVIGESLWL
jgi:hypothetical protein